MVAYAGWSMDDHFPEGFYYTAGHPTIYHPAPQPWGLPLRAMISENIRNLVFAGRNISVTHAAMSSSRVMATCAILGQAIGTAVSEALDDGCHVGDVNVKKLQQTLMADDCYIPWHTREVPSLTKNAECSADIVRNGMERGDENLWIGKEGDSVEYRFAEDTAISEIRLVFDSDLNRGYQNMPCNYPLVQPRFKLPTTLIKAYKIEGEDKNGKTFNISVCDNHERFVRHAVDWRVKVLRFVPIATHGSEEFRLFDFEIR